MENMLFLAHRLPYPPDKGDKIRSWHLLRHFAATRRVYLGCFVDDPADWAHAELIRSLCADAWIGDLSPKRARIRSLAGLATGSALTFPYFRSEHLTKWISRVRAKLPFAHLYTFSSSMAQYNQGCDTAGHNPSMQIVDLVDLDSEKWRQYGKMTKPPTSWIFQREARQLARAEVAIAQRADLSLLVSEEEAADFRRRDGVPGDRVHVLSNGVDTAYFDPNEVYARPFGIATGPAIVFTGAMDYRANVDAATWFARDVLPLIRARQPAARFFVVGARPSADVLSLKRLPGVVVTGRVDDVRPWLAHATVVVAPLRLARGIQNKVLEAMAMARAVACSPEALSGIRAEPGKHLLVADCAPRFRDAVLAYASDATLTRQVGFAARTFVERFYGWEQRFEELEELMRTVRRPVRLAMA
jgi:sugar transferase (PEP-CTERM/EpsH1 system associated)